MADLISTTPATSAKRTKKRRPSNIYQRTNGAWTAYIRVGGEQMQKTFRTQEDAQLWLARMMQRRIAGDLVPSKDTLSEWTAIWLATQETRLRPSTYQRYADNLRLHVLPRLGHLRVSAITVDHIAYVISELEREKKAAWTIRGVLVALGRVLGAAERRGHITANPVRKLQREERPSVTRRELPSLDRDALGRLITNAPAKFRTLIVVSVLTGIRQGEALGLRWDDVDLREGVIRVRRQLDKSGQLVEPKTAAAKRDIPLPTSLTRMLKKHKEEAFERGYARPTDPVFASKVGTPLAVRNIIRRGLEKALADAKLPDMSWHDLRHVAASALIAEGTSIAYLSRILGHANPSITLSVYAHAFASQEHAERTRDTMEAAYGSLLP